MGIVFRHKGHIPSLDDLVIDVQRIVGVAIVAFRVSFLRVIRPAASVKIGVIGRCPQVNAVPRIGADLYIPIPSSAIGDRFIQHMIRKGRTGVERFTPRTAIRPLCIDACAEDAAAVEIHTDEVGVTAKPVDNRARIIL